jgi:hypothetical protein
MSFSYSSLGLDKQGRYNGKQQYYWAFDSYLQDKLWDAGVHWVLENYLFNPTCPQTAYRNRDLRQDDHYDRDKIRKYERELEKSIPLIEKASGNGAEFTEAQDFDEEEDPWTEFGIPNSDPDIISQE